MSDLEQSPWFIELSDIVVDYYFQFYQSVFHRILQNPRSSGKALVCFQVYLSEIRDWTGHDMDIFYRNFLQWNNQTNKISEEWITTLVQNTFKFYMEDILLRCYSQMVHHKDDVQAFLHHGKGLDYIYPTNQSFFYQVLLQSARLLWPKVYLFHPKYETTIERNEQIQLIKSIMRDGIGKSIRSTCNLRELVNKLQEHQKTILLQPPEPKSIRRQLREHTEHRQVNDDFQAFMNTKEELLAKAPNDEMLEQLREETMDKITHENNEPTERENDTPIEGREKKIPSNDEFKEEEEEEDNSQEIKSIDQQQQDEEENNSNEQSKGLEDEEKIPLNDEFKEEEDNTEEIKTIDQQQNGGGQTTPDSVKPDNPNHHDVIKISVNSDGKPTNENGDDEESEDIEHILLQRAVDENQEKIGKVSDKLGQTLLNYTENDKPSTPIQTIYDEQISLDGSYVDGESQMDDENHLQKLSTMSWNATHFKEEDKGDGRQSTSSSPSQVEHKLKYFIEKYNL